jgi:uncharacterized integral membrane protein (TIGR00698 family)
VARSPAASRGLVHRAGVATPGLALALALAAIAWLVARMTPEAIAAVPLAVVLALLVAQRMPHERFDPGIAVATRPVLRLGIVLLGARLSLTEVAQLGVSSLGLVFGVLLVGFATAWLLGRRLGLSRELAALLGVGSAVCGNSAIMASAPILRARSRDIGLAVATITMCGTVALLTYPLLGRALGLDDTAYGLWVGLAIQDTSQVVAAGAAFSEPARDVATVVKLVRNASLALVLPLLAWWWTRTGDGTTARPGLRVAVPGFVLGFLAVVGLRTVGIIGDRVSDLLGDLAGGLILVAVAGLGLSIRVGDLRGTSLRAVATGATAALLLGALGLVAALAVGPLIA